MGLLKCLLISAKGALVTSAPFYTKQLLTNTLLFVTIHLEIWIGPHFLLYVAFLGLCANFIGSKQLRRFAYATTSIAYH